MKNRYILLLDVVLVALAAFAAFTARFDWAFYQHRPEFVPYLIAALIIKPAVFLQFGMYRRYWQYTTIKDVSMVFGAVSVSSAVMGIFVVAGLNRLFFEFSRVVVFTDLLMTFAAVAGLRVGVRILYESGLKRAVARDGAAKRRVLIVGAGAAGTMVAREMERNPQLGMEPIGFLDDDANKIGKQMGGLAVLGATRALPDILKAGGVDTVLIAMPTAPGRAVRAILSMCQDAGVKSQTIPGVFELLDGRVGVNRFRNVDIADLLRRSPANTADIATGFLRDRGVLITGAGGSIGSELARQIAGAAPSCITLLGHGENCDLRSRGEPPRGVPAARHSHRHRRHSRSAAADTGVRPRPAGRGVPCRGPQARAVDGTEPGRGDHQ